MQKALIYCRVSTDEQAEKGYSLEAQEKLCRSFAEGNGYNITGVYRDEGRSGTSLDRPAIKELLSNCQGDNSINAVIVQETDRLARNTKDHLTIKALLQKTDVKLISVAQPMLDDSPEGNMIDTILASVNQFQSDINSRKTKKGLQEKFDEGWWPGLAPLGYLNVADGQSSNERKARKIVKKDPERWYLIKEGFEMYLTGKYSADHINDILYQKGLRSRTGKKIPHSIIVSKILKNPFYTGLMRWNRQEKMGNHTPMISQSQHNHILQIIASHNNYACRRRKHSFLLRGFIFCNQCGQRYTAERHSEKNKEYYHCASSRKHSSKGQNIEVSLLEKEIEEQFKKIQFSADFIELVLKRLGELYHQQQEVITQQSQALYNKKKAIELKRNKVEEKLLSGVLSDDDFVRLRDDFRSRLDSVQNRIDELNCQREYEIDVIQEVVKLTRNVYKTYKTAPYELKREYLGLFWDKFLVQDRKIVKAIPTKLIQVLQENQKVIISSNWLPSSPLIITLLKDTGYIVGLRERLSIVKQLHRYYKVSQVKAVA